MQGNKVVFCSGGYNKDATTGLDSTYIYDPVADTHTPGPTLPFRIYKHRVIKRTTTNDYIFVGGSAVQANNTKTYDYLWSFNFNTDMWITSHPTLGVGRLGHGVTLINDEADLIVAGGKEYITSFVITYSVEIYNFATSTWSNRNPLPGPSNEFSFLIKKDGVFTAISSTADIVYEYDELNDQWNQVTGVATAGVIFDSSLVDTEELYKNCG